MSSNFNVLLKEPIPRHHMSLEIRHTTVAPVLVCPLPSHGRDGGGCTWLVEWAAAPG